MIFRTVNGELMEININDYITDIEYYKRIMIIMTKN